MKRSTVSKAESLPGGTVAAAKGKSFLSLLIRGIPIAILLISIVLISTFSQYFLTLRNLNGILLQASSLGLMSLGITFVLIVGGIDLSIPPVMALAAIFGVMFMRSGGDALLGGFIMIGMGLLGGAINGFAVSRMRMIPFVVTLSMQAIAYGACLWITQAVGISGLQPVFVQVVLAKVGGVSLPIIFVVALVVVAQLLMKRSLLGRWLYLTGTNIRMAQVSGVQTKVIVFGAYLLSGLLAGLAAIILAARLGSASPSLGESGVVMDIIGSAVIGGASIYGGAGTAVGAFLGAVLITVISNGLNMLHVSYFNMLSIKGAVIIAFVALDSLRRRSAPR